MDQKEQRANDLGAEHGRAAASWIDQEYLPRFVEGIIEGDPEKLDALPQPDLSGQWADGFSSRDLERALDLDEDEAVDEYAELYEQAFREAVEASIQERSEALT